MENIDANALEALRRQRRIELVDVRTEQEVRRGMISGARHIPLQELPSRLQEIPRDRPVVFYCQSGARSMQAGAFLASRGWAEVYNLRGGVQAWVRDGLPMASPEAT